jgi:2-haloalkanoic acid dehalogenase type II
MSALDFRAFDALRFDCYGTLIDWEPGLEQILVAWARSHCVGATEDELLASFGEAESWAPATNPAAMYPDILRMTMRLVSERMGVVYDPAVGETLANSVGGWLPFPDTREALSALNRRYRLVILSNVDNASWACTRPRLGVEFDLVLTAEDLGSYKPALRNFETMADRVAGLGIDRSRVLHVAQSLFHDHAPARRLGFRSVWIDRRHGRAGSGAIPRTHGATPDLEFPSMQFFVGAVDQAFAG